MSKPSAIEFWVWKIEIQNEMRDYNFVSAVCCLLSESFFRQAEF